MQCIFIQGFEHHVKEEHNQWAYLFFFIHLDETRPNDYSSVELYISRRVGCQLNSHYSRIGNYNIKGKLTHTLNDGTYI